MPHVVKFPIEVQRTIPSNRHRPTTPATAVLDLQRPAPLIERLDGIHVRRHLRQHDHDRPTTLQLGVITLDSKAQHCCPPPARDFHAAHPASFFARFGSRSEAVMAGSAASSADCASPAADALS